MNCIQTDLVKGLCEAPLLLTLTEASQLPQEEPEVYMLLALVPMLASSMLHPTCRPYPLQPISKL